MPDLSVQLYTVREALAEDYDGTLAALAGFGFTQVEPFGFDAFADELRDGLAKHGLSAPTAHVGLLRGDSRPIFALATELGIGTVIDPSVDPGALAGPPTTSRPDRRRAQRRRRQGRRSRA